MAIFEGAGVALVTPFKENGEVNYEKLEELVEEQIENHTDCIVAVGTTGEASTMTEEEHIERAQLRSQLRSIPRGISKEIAEILNDIEGK